MPIINDAHEYVNAALRAVQGEDSAILAQDYSNIVDIGSTVINKIGYDVFSGALVDRIMATRFGADSSRTYRGSMPDISRTMAGYGTMIQKIRVEAPKAEQNETWELQDGAVYEQDQYTMPIVSVKYFNHLNTYEFPVSITRKQMQTAFTSSDKLNAFVAYIFKVLDDQITDSLDELTRSLYKNMIGDTLYTSYSGSGYGDSSKVKAVNLLYLYNQIATTPIQAEDALHDPAFLRFASEQMALYKTRLTGRTRLFNMGGALNFTPESDQKWVILNDFAKAADFNLYGDVFHNEFVELPNASIIPFWQGSGNDYSFASTSKIYGVTAMNNSVEMDGILAVVHDSEALAIANSDRYVDTHHNGKASFDNYWYKLEENDICDYNENFVVFFIKDATT